MLIRIDKLTDAQLEAAIAQERRRRAIVADATAEVRQMHIATRGISTTWDDREHRITQATREFYLERGRFPSTYEMLRWLWVPQSRGAWG